MLLSLVFAVMVGAALRAPPRACRRTAPERHP